MPRPPKLYPSFANPDRWRMWSYSDQAEREFRATRSAILMRDANTCQYCGFQAPKWMIVHHVNGDPRNNSDRNLVTICQACNLIVHSGFGCKVAEVVDLYRMSRCTQVEVIRRTSQLRAQGDSDQSIIWELGLERRVRFRMDRDYLRDLVGFISARRPRKRDVGQGLGIIIANEKQRLIEDRRAQERVRKVGPNRIRQKNFSANSALKACAIVPSGLLRSTFVHVPGIGGKTEEKIWKSGIHSWDEFRHQSESNSFLRRRRKSVIEVIKRCESELPRGNLSSLERLSKHGDTWRLFDQLRERALYLDIETTGLSMEWDHITVIGAYDGSEFRFFVHGRDLEEFPDYAQSFGLVITFNGSTFDLPWIKKRFGPAALPQPAWDLRWSLRRLGYNGPLHRVEARTGVQRPKGLRPITGFDATVLWKAYLSGSKAALDILKRYCGEDVASLPVLADKAFNLLAGRLPIATRTHAVRKRPRPGIPVDNSALRHILSYRFSRRPMEVIAMESFESAHNKGLTPSKAVDRYWISEFSTRCRKRVGDTGKWIIPVARNSVDDLWRKIATNVRRGLLGKLSLGAKVSTRLPNSNSPNPEEHVICVFSPDGKNIPEVMRLRRVLTEIGVTRKIPFKSDAATAAGVYAVHGGTAVAEFWA